MGQGIRNSEYFYNHEQIATFVPCHDGGSEILTPCGIKNRLLFCSVKLWARGSEILNLSKKESAMGVRSLSHEIAQFDGIGKLDVLFLVDTTEHFFSPSNQRKPFRNANFFSIKYQYSSEFSQIGKPHFSLEGGDPYIN